MIEPIQLRYGVIATTFMITGSAMIEYNALGLLNAPRRWTVRPEKQSQDQRSESCLSSAGECMLFEIFGRGKER